MANLFAVPTVAIPLKEYEELLRESEKIECVKHYVRSTAYPNIDVVIAILERGKEDTNGSK